MANGNPENTGMRMVSKRNVLSFLFCLAWILPSLSWAGTPDDSDGDDGEEIIEEPAGEEEPPPEEEKSHAADEIGNPDEGRGGSSLQTLEGPGPVPSSSSLVPSSLSRLRKPPRVYNPSFGFQGQFFVETHPTDSYFGVSFSAQFHLSQQFSASFDIRAGGGIDRDEDHYTHPLGSVGGSLAYWWHGWDRIRRWRPYARIGLGWMGLGDEVFDDGSDDEDWDKSRVLKKNGAPAAGHSNLYAEEALGLRWVLFPRLWYLAVGGALDLDVALVQDFHYAISESGIRFSFGLTIFF